MNCKLLSCHLRIWTDLTLEELGALISISVLGGVCLVGREESIRDEVPALFAEREILGSQVVLMGEPDEEGYVLEMTPTGVMVGMTPGEIRAALTDMAPLIRSLLSGDPRLRFE